MSDIEETHSPYSSPLKPTRYETKLKPIKNPVMTLNFDLVSGNSFYFSNDSLNEWTEDSSSIDPVKLNIKNCFMLRKASKSSDSSATEISRTSEPDHDETTANDRSNVTKIHKDKHVSKSEDALSTELFETSELEIDDPILENAFQNVTNPSMARVVPKTTKKARSRPAKEKTLVCDVCKMGFVFKLSFEKHLLTHRGANCDGIFKCDLCDKGFLTKRNVSKHFKKVHAPPTIYNCEECPKYFRSRCGFRDHKRAHHGPKDECLACPTCGKIFTLEKSLKNHLKTSPSHDVGTSGGK